MRSWFGPIDGLLRAASAIGTYEVLLYIQGRWDWEPPFLVGEAVAVVVAILVSALASTKIWRPPSLDLEWKVGDRIIEDRVFSIRSGDARKRRVVTHSVSVPGPSFLSWLVLHRLAKEPVHLCLKALPGGVFHASEDNSLPGVVVTPMPTGFKHSIPDLTESGVVVAMTRIEWEPAQVSIPARCRVKYSLECSSISGRLLARLVHLDASVKAIEFGH